MSRTVHVLTPAVDTRVGGVERFANSLAAALRDEWNVRLVEVRQTAPAWAEKLALGYAWNSRSATGQLEGVGPRDLVVSSGLLGWGGLKDGRRIHVFHGTMPGAALASGRAAPRRDRLRRLVGGGLAELLSARGAHTVAVSAETGEEVGRRYGRRVDAVVENGVDTELFRPRDRRSARAELGWDEEERIALFVGTPEARKGIDLAIAAARRVGARLLVAARHAPAGADHLGLLDPQVLAKAYNAADCVLFPTRYEACSYTVLETLASGTPLVTTAVGWTRDLGTTVPEYRPLLVRPEVDSVVDGLRCALTEDLSCAVRAARQLVVEQNSTATFGRAWRELCRTVADRVGDV